METSIIESSINRLKMGHYAPDPQKVYIHIKGGKELLNMGLHRFVEDSKWQPEYDEVADWLEDNHGRGLLLMGNVGRGKTVVGCKILPPLIHCSHRLVVNVYDAMELNGNSDQIMSQHLVCIDDVGKENESVKYGERRVPFAELVDRAEKDGKLLILTTNLNVDELTQKYGDRTVDRLRAITKVVLFKGESLRK